ncbi:Hypothetical protein LUCI_0642 [Lucifera butyrica]|uniref:Uncharacterized protein n=1 Tax=Lucifera butyrica TaxID=1351585 RepID=A0A498R5G1_9FIRM|nr:Hypothetical protein LUCI_0642 [Lucifera butyrica]
MWFFQTNRVIWFLVLIISLWVLLFPEVFATSTEFTS